MIKLKFLFILLLLFLMVMPGYSYQGNHYKIQTTKRVFHKKKYKIHLIKRKIYATRKQSAIASTSKFGSK